VASYGFDQGTDYAGCPNTTVHVGLLTVVLTGEVAASPVWEELMFDPYRRESGHLVFFQGEDQTFKRITFYEAACVFYEYRFDARGQDGKGSFETELRFSAATLDVQGQRVDAHSIIPWVTDAATSRRALTQPPEPSLGLPMPTVGPIPALPPPPVLPPPPPLDAPADKWAEARANIEVKANEETVAEEQSGAYGEAYEGGKQVDRKTAYLTEADPVRDILGPGKKSHPEEWNNTIDELKKEGVEVIITNEEKLAYAPGLRAGEPGQIHLNNDASIGALRHEYQHFLDDKAAGYKGMRGLYDLQYRKQTEINAYGREIQLMEETGNHEAANKLKENLAKELQRLDEDFGGTEIE
jgi:hypothetical protein